MMAVKIPTLSAAVPYYGGQPRRRSRTNKSSAIALRRFRQPRKVGLPMKPFSKRIKVENTAYTYPGVNHMVYQTTPR
jgi:carboxymethylenebutenolidase